MGLKAPLLAEQVKWLLESSEKVIVPREETSLHRLPPPHRAGGPAALAPGAIRRGAGADTLTLGALFTACVLFARRPL